MALLSYFTILPWLYLDHCLTSAIIMEAKTKACQKRRPYLKLDDGMRASVFEYALDYLYAQYCIYKFYRK